MYFIPRTKHQEAFLFIEKRPSQRRRQLHWPFFSKAIHGLIPSGSLKAVQIIPYNLWTGPQIRENKRGAISENEPSIMDRLGIDAENWLYIAQNFESEFKGIVGAVDEVKSKISLFWDDQRERRRTAGIQACKLRLS